MSLESSEYLLSALENVLGKSHLKARGNRSFHCPFCHHRKEKLEINLDENSPYYGCWECWVCGTKGRSIKSLLAQLKLSRSEAAEILQYVKKGAANQTSEYYTKRYLRLPEEFIPLSTAPTKSFDANRYRQYLYRRGLTDNDFIKYSIGYCSKGKYENNIIIPSYDESNCLNYFIARSLDPGAFRKYSNPDVQKDSIIFFDNMVNWHQPLILVEGVFDALAVRRNVVPLLGKHISSALMKKIIENKTPEVYICLDRDAIKDSLKHCEMFLNMGINVYLVKPEAKDPSEQGFESFTRQLQEAEELTLKDLIRYKLFE